MFKDQSLKSKLGLVAGLIFCSNFFLSLPLRSASALAAWALSSDGSLKLRTSSGTKLDAFFQPSTNDKGERVWVDFPGELSRPRTLKGNGSVKEIRLGKPSDGITRLVIEFLPSVELEYSKLKLIGISPNTWELKFIGLESNSFSSIGEGNILRNSIKRTFEKINIQDLDISSLPNVPYGKYKVVIDPGHGGSDPGAVGINGLRETDIVLEVSKNVSEFLTKKGVKTLLTRNYERTLDLQPRVEKANNSKADAFVSIHANATRGKRKEVNGLETYYYSGYKGYSLAKNIHKQILITSTQSPDRGVRRSRFYVIRKTSMPAALVEIGFVTGIYDASLLRQKAYRYKMSFAIAKGILNYLKVSN
ncbi:N-acetylmuramoyl-L-alanine amidase [Prochlorococcus marinus]|uniref:N-acetylmuramoyl-L-alanine amidase n=1 Tax=Prochlorococcus marinus XMU1408 TaxID=2213228 RepID=A0A318R0E9_PROMR|nr:N-acetylmuramoyl-L-alanine amidase [Prochlorococcus marinus]MBW3041643.1 N-acetylmuramoyl-L-alanine amidase [Prochlorococcus marinus str. XMU1408]PYE02796.1 N-acetylmuramoyl-L-alanine amidase [Prochlorococcus marinus XMU1408]